MPRSFFSSVFVSAITVLTLLLGCFAMPGRAQELAGPSRAFFSRYCFDCHGDGADEGGVQLDTISTDLGDRATFATWERVFDRVRDGEMPPADAEQPSADDRRDFLGTLQQSLHQSHAESKGTILRRLNRREYQNTMNDLFGTHLDLASMLPEDGRFREFDNVGASLNLSMVQLQSYIDAADAVMDQAIASTSEPPEIRVTDANYAQTREGEVHLGKSWKLLDDGAVVFFRSQSYPTGMLRTANVHQAGWYKVAVTGYAYQSREPITFSIGATTFARGAEKPTFAYRAFEPGPAQTVQIEAWIDDRYMIDLEPWGIADQDNSIRKHGIDQYQGPGLAILNVRLEGPITESFPSRGHRLIFDGIDRVETTSGKSRQSRRSRQAEFEIRSEDPSRDTAQAIRRVARAAFRRPVTDREIAPFLELFEQQRGNGIDFEPALRTAVAAIFCSPDFLFLRESADWLDDHALAARLSFFLTRTTPDQALLADADAGRLTGNPETLLRHSRRLLKDPRGKRFVEDFTDAWLNLRDIDFTSPDQKLFPEYDSFLQASMLEESRRFFAALIEQNASVVNLVDSEFAMLNNRLAEHYDLDLKLGPEIRQVTLPRDSVRGGLLGQASVLKVSANGTNTSPVVRGVYVLERLLGVSPPPPPPGIPGVEPDIRGASTLRELLDKHRDVDSCRHCHSMIDPPGFALESFNPIGGWRDHFRSLGKGEKVDRIAHGRPVRYRIGPPVDATGRMSDGTTFENYVQFRRLLASDPDRLAQTLVTKLLTFATGREMGFSDRPEIERLVNQSRDQGHGVRDLVQSVVASEIFRKK
ncbi:DUF1592 domain-containing protein [Roseiconus nitratireducens]|uniref:DUF1592 domain-containing protein n=1 Tax=Roseiconus nitratireducens TaxID=2605748 RepID=A0A5M6DD01_9BACT|nr:DUF1592 domain-containing protein [Roseiconus nitratireducens]KAA5544280.1 DUF1592 domain-containing protein [Roseiconus nitratireducens]